MKYKCHEGNVLFCARRSKERHGLDKILNLINQERPFMFQNVLKVCLEISYKNMILVFPRLLLSINIIFHLMVLFVFI
jgi:hypothetical protein